MFKKDFTQSLCARPLCKVSTPGRCCLFCEMSVILLNPFLFLMASSTLTSAAAAASLADSADWSLQVCQRVGFQFKILLTNKMLFSSDKCKVLPQAGGTEHANAERCVEKDLGFVLIHQLNTSQQQHTITKNGKPYLRDKQGCCQQETWNDPSPSVGKSKASGGDVSSFSQHISSKIDSVKVA